MTFYSQKMIPVENQYEININKLLVIVEAFKTYQYYLEGCKYEVFVLIDYNNLYHFIDLSSRQV